MSGRIGSRRAGLAAFLALLVTPARPAGLPPGASEVRIRVEALVAEARARVSGLVSGPHPDRRFVPMARLLDRITGVGEPRLQSVGRQPGCWSVPLMSGTTAASSLFARLDGTGVIEWPHRFAAREAESNLIPPGTFTILDTFPHDGVPALTFFPPPDSAVMAPVMFDAIELGRLVKVIGLPVRDGEAVEGRLPHITRRSYAKRLKESAAWVARVNARPRPVPWKTVSGPRSVSAKCWSYAFSFAVDWWNQELGRPRGLYRSYLTGELERGFDPRALELLYREEAARQPDTFVHVPPAFLEDPVTGEPILSNMDAFASLLVRKERVVLSEPVIPDLLGETREVDGRSLPMGRSHRRLFHLNGGDHRTVTDGLHRHGIVIAGEVHRYRGCPLYYSTHAVPVVGHIEIGGSPYLAYLDAQMSARRAGEPLMRAYPVSMFSEAYCFPHEVTIRARVRRVPAGLTIRVRLENQAGRTLTGADRVVLRGADGLSLPFRAIGRGYELALARTELAHWGTRAVIHAEQPYYYGAAGTGADHEIRLDQISFD